MPRPDLFNEWLDAWFTSLMANPSATEADFNGKAVFDAFVAHHPLTDDEYFMLAWVAGDKISQRVNSTDSPDIQEPLEQSDTADPAPVSAHHGTKATTQSV